MSLFNQQPIVLQQCHTDGAFPLVLVPSHEVINFDEVAQQREALMALLAVHGAIVFRGCDISGDQRFDRFVTAFALENFPYDESLSNAVRRNRTPRIFTANEAPCDVEIFLHHEMAQTPLFPRYLFFCCEQAAEVGGATPLCRSDVLLQRLQASMPHFIKRCREKGACYSLVMPGVPDQASGQGRSWRDTLGVESREAAEARLASLDYQWQWLPEECLAVITPALPLIRQTSAGQEVFFNQLIAAFCGWQDQRNEQSRSVTYGDGTPIDEEDLKAATDIAYELTFDLNWQAGDVALIDNDRVMHGRRPFQGSRSVLASLCTNAASD
jgi:hypothetical protein